MEWSYTYTPFVWPLLASAALAAALGLYAFRHRTVPGGVPILLLATSAFLWILANTLRHISTIDETRIFWFKFEAVLLPLLVSAALCFALEYSGLGKWLTRRTVAMLAVMPLVYMLLILTNEVHHLVWTRIWFNVYMHADFGPMNWCILAYSYLLSLLHVIVLARLFVISPPHRWIAGWLIVTPLITRAAYISRVVDWNPVPPFDLLVIAINLALLPYFLAFFRFHMFDAVPVARDMVIEQMPDGIVVLDAQNRVVDVNEKAQKLFGIFRSKVIGGRVEEVFHAHPDLLAFYRDSDTTREKLIFENTNERWVLVSVSPVVDRRGFHVGRLIWLHDVTERRQAQEKILDKERTLAMLQERELLARELHDGIGQMLAAAHLQARSASELLARGEKALAESCLRRLADVTQEAKESVRTYLLGVKACSPSRGDSLVLSLRRYLDGFSRNYGIRAEVIAPLELETKRVNASVEAQLQPIIQEALTNARRHGGADSVRVILSSVDGWVQVSIEDDGRGFNPEEISKKQGFGVRSMQGRAETIGGFFEVNSAPGKGTRVIVRVPWEKEKS
jgi:PAS domain S-box-containing protein